MEDADHPSNGPEPLRDLDERLAVLGGAEQPAPTSEWSPPLRRLAPRRPDDAGPEAELTAATVDQLAAAVAAEVEAALLPRIDQVSTELRAALASLVRGVEVLDARQRAVADADAEREAAAAARSTAVASQLEALAASVADLVKQLATLELRLSQLV